MTAPQTAFELLLDDNPAWTSRVDEQAFLAAVASDSGRATLTNLGSSVGGNPINMVAVGYPAAPTETELKGKSVALLIGLQHGNEPSGREMLLQKLRDMAYTTDPAMQAYLRDHPVIFLPTLNPDRIGAGRSNNNGNDINRQWLSYADGEVQAASIAIRKYAPHIIVDFHEKPGGGSAQFEFLHPTNPEVLTSISSLSSTMRAAGAAALNGAGYTTDLYGGGTNANILRNSGGLQNIITVLGEASGQGSTTLLTRKDAVAGCSIFADEIFTYHATNEDTIKATVTRARLDSKQAGEDQDPIADPSIAPPLGYSLNNVQYTTASTSLDRLRLKAIPLSDASGYFVSMAQGSKRILPQLVDGSATDNIVVAKALTVEPALAAAPDAYNVQWREAGGIDLAGAELAHEGLTLTAIDLNPATDYEWAVQKQGPTFSSPWTAWEPFTTLAAPAAGAIGFSAFSSDGWQAVCNLSASFSGAASVSDTSSDNQAAIGSFESIATGSATVDSLASAGGALAAGAYAGESWAANAQVVVSLLQNSAASDEIRRATDDAISAATKERSEASDTFLTSVGVIASLSDSASVSDAFVAVVGQLASLSFGAEASDSFNLDFGFPGSIRSGALSSESWYLMASIATSLSEVCTASDLLSARADAFTKVTFGATASSRFAIVNDGIRYLAMGSIILRSALNYSINIKP